MPFTILSSSFFSFCCSILLRSGWCHEVWTNISLYSSVLSVLTVALKIPVQKTHLKLIKLRTRSKIWGVDPRISSQWLLKASMLFLGLQLLLFTLLCLLNFRLPFWSYAKLIAVCWLVLPCFNGAPYVYEHFIRPFYWNAQTATIWHFPMNRGLFHKQDDLMTAAEKYMKMHGTEAFERLIKNAEMARAMRRENMQYDEHYR